MARILGLALLALLLVLLLTLPATVLLRFSDASEQLQRPQGTVWSGQARWHQPGQQPLPVQWRWQRGTLWRWQASDRDTNLNGLWRPGRSLELPEVAGRLAMDRVDLGQWLRVSRPQGFLELELAQVELAAGQVPRAQGQVLWRQAALSGAIHESLGEIRLRLQPTAEILRIEVESLQPAPIMVRGEILVDVETYQVDLWLRADRARPELVRALLDLGEAQADGQVRLRFQGMSGF